MFCYPHHLQLNVKIVLFQTIQFDISTQFSSIWPMGSTLLAATTLGQSGPGSHGNDTKQSNGEASVMLEVAANRVLSIWPMDRTLLAADWANEQCVCVCVCVYIYIYLRKNKTGHIRIINLFLSCYGFLI